MLRCPACGAKLAIVRVSKTAPSIERWKRTNAERYRQYMRRYMKGYRARKREAASQG